ncbi:DUF805 domain-containing protein [Arthrobacter sp. UM1]|uniref:DUF805 domain-containing protein n=1 Tax=Arthrobacter sp. UM1 TaxID=2766776 RepID=UPI001CF66773|nr:DUF805 domain-containing protein [Arthrobacter sp. UM1]MCB4208648.1 DUF805 domain-containing protein [Arthrobacter sp. UM1]
MSNDSQSPYEGQAQSQFNSYGQDSGSGMPAYGGHDGAQYGQGGYGSQPYGQQPYGQPGYGVQGATLGQPVGGTPENLDLPLYGATLPQAFTRFFKRYANFHGRSSRSEFWWMSLVVMVV